MKYLDTLSNLVSKMSTRLLGLEFKSDNIIKLKAIKFIVKKILPEYKQQCKPNVSVVKNILRTKFQMLENINKKY